jgi:hypothetical protein
MSEQRKFDASKINVGLEPIKTLFEGTENSVKTKLKYFFGRLPKIELGE